MRIGRGVTRFTTIADWTGAACRAQERGPMGGDHGAPAKTAAQPSSRFLHFVGQAVLFGR